MTDKAAVTLAEPSPVIMRQARLAAETWSDPRRAKLVVVLKGLGPEAGMPAHEQGAYDILWATIPSAPMKGGRKRAFAGQVLEWPDIGKHPRRRLLAYGQRGATDAEERRALFKARMLGPPPEWHHGILLHAGLMFGTAAPSVAQLRLAALALHAATSRNHTDPNELRFAYTVLRVARDLRGEALPVYADDSGPAGKLAVPYVAAICAALGLRNPLAGARCWPAAYRHADRLIGALSKHSPNTVQ